MVQDRRKPLGIHLVGTWNTTVAGHIDWFGNRILFIALFRRGTTACLKRTTGSSLRLYPNLRPQPTL